MQETLEIARDVAKKLIESQSTAAFEALMQPPEVFDYPLIVAL